ncbi:hypothetical protein GWI33_017425 [Rhynchophorus ferrugineus]|uniref:Uncharacterized protein n=1 Tax=Rhynchophorus ferrugineus TaxID=354439 RepID=A0A834I1Z3_RHYFE|nr:hypothetical protein GWI33_017425 [Rhynchophorus ferrugineus]
MAENKTPPEDFDVSENEVNEESYVSDSECRRLSFSEEEEEVAGCSRTTEDKGTSTSDLEEYISGQMERREATPEKKEFRVEYDYGSTTDDSSVQDEEDYVPYDIFTPLSVAVDHHLNNTTGGEFNTLLLSTDPQCYAQQYSYDYYKSLIYFPFTLYLAYVYIIPILTFSMVIIAYWIVVYIYGFYVFSRY